MRKKIILASLSPRRKKIFEQLHLDFNIIPPDYDEILENSVFTYEKVEETAYRKAKSVLEKIKNTPEIINSHSIIFSADTIVILEGKILGKPVDKEDAIKMLKKLSGKKHSVVTSICTIDLTGFKKKILSTTSFVEFKTLSDKLILKYIKEFNPLDKAGSYGIQELPEGFIEKVEGSFENIIGLCPSAVKEILNRI